jgi:hypothetical protein
MPEQRRCRVLARAWGTAVRRDPIAPWPDRPLRRRRRGPVAARPAAPSSRRVRTRAIRAVELDRSPKATSGFADRSRSWATGSTATPHSAHGRSARRPGVARPGGLGARRPAAARPAGGRRSLVGGDRFRRPERRRSACDPLPAWNLFAGGSRERFRAELEVDNAAWLRGAPWRSSGRWRRSRTTGNYWDTNPGMVRQAAHALAHVLPRRLSGPTAKRRPTTRGSSGGAGVRRRGRRRPSR